MLSCNIYGVCCLTKIIIFFVDLKDFMMFNYILKDFVTFVMYCKIQDVSCYFEQYYEVCRGSFCCFERLYDVNCWFGKCYDV